MVGSEEVGLVKVVAADSATEAMVEDSVATERGVRESTLRTST